jgi:sec-independent protein translocase protein TatB
MPSFSDSAVLIVLALLLFGPKKLPVLARQLGKLMADFRRASNEFRTQMEEELRISEQADRQKKLAAIETAAPVSPAIAAPTEAIAEPELSLPTEAESEAWTRYDPVEPNTIAKPSEPVSAKDDDAPEAFTASIPIATNGDLSVLPPSTGLPVANSPAHEAELETETLHG